MMLFVDGIHAGAHRENVGYYIQSYESGFDLLTQLVTDHWTLESAIIVDNGDCLSLPIDAFDGEPMRKPISALQQQWHELLSIQPARPLALPRLKDRYVQLDTHYGELQTRLEELIVVWRIRINKWKNQQNESCPPDLISQYHLWLERASRIYQQIVEHRYQNWQRLQRLEKDTI